MKLLATAVVSLSLTLIGCATSSTDPQPTLPAAAPTEAQAAPTPAVAPTAQPVPVNTLRWTTASEVDNLGFDIYRGESEDGPFVRITPEPIPGAGTIDEPQSYVFVDDTNDPSKGYYYYIESISVHGVRERFSPVQYVKPKRPPLEPTPAP